MLASDISTAVPDGCSLQSTEVFRGAGADQRHHNSWGERNKICKVVNLRSKTTRFNCFLQTVQIMVGLCNIGLGPGRTSINPGDLTSLGAAYWLGAVVNYYNCLACFFNY